MMTADFSFLTVMPSEPCSHNSLCTFAGALSSPVSYAHFISLPEILQISPLGKAIRNDGISRWNCQSLGRIRANGNERDERGERDESGRKASIANANAG